MKIRNALRLNASSNSVDFKKSFLVIVAIYFVSSVFMRFMANEGDFAPETIQHLLKYFTANDIEQGLEYRRSGFLVSLISKCVSMALLITFVFTPLSKKIEAFFGRKTNNNFLLMCLGFLIVYFVIETVIFLPFSYYFGFVREHQFGFSSMTFADWATVRIKSIGVNGALTIPLELGALMLLKWFRRAWIYIVPVAFFVVQLFLTAIWPSVITPIFYDYAPLEDGTLRQKIIALADKANISVENIFKINESKYSSHTNAYFVGWGSHKKIFLYDTLIAKQSEDEVISVLGHEIGHWQHDHHVKGVLIATMLLLVGGVLVRRLFAMAKRDPAMHLNEIYSPSTLPFVFLLLSCMSLVSTPIESAISRAHETAADLVALILTEDPKSFIESEIKIARDNKAMLNPHPFIVWFGYSHPPAIERIEMAEKYIEHVSALRKQ